MTTSPTIEIANHQLSADIGIPSENVRGEMMAHLGFGDCAVEHIRHRRQFGRRPLLYREYHEGQPAEDDRARCE